MSLELRSDNCRWDCVSLGEIMLRLDPGEGRIHTTREFNVCEGGGEYNVARGLRSCFGLKTAVVSTFADNPLGRLLEDLILQGGVDSSLIRWTKYDGIGKSVRNGLNFTERGFGVRAAIGCSDRGNTAVSQMKPGDVDWDSVFGTANGSRWFHTGGIFAGLSESTAQLAVEATQAARKNRTIVSYDLNYRESLWKAIGGKAKAQEVNRQLVLKTDVLIGNEEDFSATLGIELEGITADFDELPIASYERLLRQVSVSYPNLKLIAATLRTARTATRNDWGAIAFYNGELLSVPQRSVEILDRVGGCGVAHGALAMTTPGDTSMATLAEVENVMKGAATRIAR